MALRKIVLRGDEILTKHCKPVKNINERIRVLAGDMVDTMVEADGVGLAAPQVGVIKRLFVCRPHLDDQEKIYVMINPEITSKEGKQDSEEGCLSFPGYIGLVERPEKVTIKYQDLEGDEHEQEFEGFDATVICHEYDHLDGIVYTDIASRVLTVEEYQEILRQQQEEAEKAAAEAGEKGDAED
jgi:peptide deformylase